MIQNVLVLGAGSAGLLAAIAFKRKAPAAPRARGAQPGTSASSAWARGPRRIFRAFSSIISASAGSVSTSWRSRRGSWASALSGGRASIFDYSFSSQLDSHWSDLPRPTGFYCDEEFGSCRPPFRAHGAGQGLRPAAHRRRPGHPRLARVSHREQKFVDVLELIAREPRHRDHRRQGDRRGPRAGRASRRCTSKTAGSSAPISTLMPAASAANCSGARFEEPYISYSPVAVLRSRSHRRLGRGPTNPSCLTPPRKPWTPAGAGRSSTSTTSIAATSIHRGHLRR